MALAITQRPTKTIGQAISNWSAVHNPIVYKLTATDFLDKEAYRAEIRVYEVGTNTLLGVAEIDPFSDGSILFDASVYVKPYLKQKTHLFNLDKVNQADPFGNVTFYITTKELYDGSTEDEISDEGNNTVATDAAQQIGQSFGSNMGAYYPSSNISIPVTISGNEFDNFAEWSHSPFAAWSINPASKAQFTISQGGPASLDGILKHETLTLLSGVNYTIRLDEQIPAGGVVDSASVSLRCGGNLSSVIGTEAADEGGYIRTVYSLTGDDAKLEILTNITISGAGNASIRLDKISAVKLQGENKAKFLTDFDQMVYFENLPFTMSFIYSSEIGGKELVKWEEKLDVNGNSLGKDSYELDGSQIFKNNFLRLEGGYSEDVAFIDVWLEVTEDDEILYVEEGYVLDGYIEVL